MDVQRDTSPPSAPLFFTFKLLLAPVTNWEPHGVTLAGYCYAMRHGMNVQIVIPFRVIHLQSYGVTDCSKVTSVYPPLRVAVYSCTCASHEGIRGSLGRGQIQLCALLASALGTRENWCHGLCTRGEWPPGTPPPPPDRRLNGPQSRTLRFGDNFKNRRDIKTSIFQGKLFYEYSGEETVI
jgi:hypothetical protein